MADPADDSRRARIGRRLWVAPGSLAAGSRELSRADDADAYHYLCRVRRARPGEAVVLFDGRGQEAVAVVRAIDSQRALLDVQAPVDVAEAPACRVTLAPALIKGERMDECIHKLVELGVSRIAPVITERTVVRLEGERARKREQRFRDIARDAVRQSQRAVTPDIQPIATLADFLAEREPCALDLMASTVAGARPLAEVLPEAAPPSVCVLIGPEGGFEAGELEACRRAGFAGVGLGRYILRADTAAVAVLAALKAAYGELAD